MDGFYAALDGGLIHTCQYLQNNMVSSASIIDDLRQWTIHTEDAKLKQGIVSSL